MSLREQSGAWTRTRPRCPDDDLNAASPQRAGFHAGVHPEDRPRCTDEQRLHGQTRRSPVAQYDVDVEEDDTLYRTRVNTSARRYVQPMQTGQTMMRVQHHPVPQRQSRTQEVLRASRYQHSPIQQGEQEEAPQPQPSSVKRHGVHWLVYVGLTMFVMLIGWQVLNLFLNWWQVSQDDLHYGRPRTYQTDATVGHNDAITPSHFLVENLNRHIVVVEFPGGDTSQATICNGPVLVGHGQDLAVVTVSFKDVNGDGRPDMIVQVQDNRFVFINDAGKFRPQSPNDHISL